ncbi:hypothetical protein LTR53_002448 [Teratosphaeriaceae sp. CCFEE 6253]|nr:hypothetical protein LTR53_002448 [Teratosphaeriaceae sp. CCFEE 6253]
MRLPSRRLASALGHPDKSTLAARRREIEDAFQHAWGGYARHCLGHDSLHPVSNTCGDDHGGWGAIAFDALSTAIVFQKEHVVEQILAHIATVDWSVVVGGTSVQLVEVTNRHLASMLSAWDLLSGPFAHIAPQEDLRESLYQQMVELGAVLSCGFSTPTGIPRNWVDPTLCTTDSAYSNTIAGAGSLVLEFARLSDITGHRMYVELMRKAEQHLLNPGPVKYEPWPGLLGTNVRIVDGQLVDRKGSWGAMSDSFYEYLLKAYIYDNQAYTDHLERWMQAASSTIRHIASHPYGRPEWTMLPYWEAGKLVHAMDAASWFSGGNFILGGTVTGNQTLVDFGLSIADAAGAVYATTATGLGGEFVVWTDDCSAAYVEEYELAHCNGNNSFQISNPEYRLRPEVIETWYHAYRATKNIKYREWAWSAFRAVTTLCKTDSGFSAISDVNAADGGRMLDHMEHFAELFMYLWLIHVEDDNVLCGIVDGDAGAHQTWVLNTRAHPLMVNRRSGRARG